MEHLTLNLTVDEINTVLSALGEKPYREVHGLIVKIQRQAELQLQHSQGEPLSRSAANEHLHE
jgi:hypothetical protein